MIGRRCGSRGVLAARTVVGRWESVAIVVVDVVSSCRVVAVVVICWLPDQGTGQVRLARQHAVRSSRGAPKTVNSSGCGTEVMTDARDGNPTVCNVLVPTPYVTGSPSRVLWGPATQVPAYRLSWVRVLAYLDFEWHVVLHTRRSPQNLAWTTWRVWVQGSA